MTRKHVMILPLPGYGHYLPCLELARKIQPFHDVTLAITASKEAEIRQRKAAPPSPIRFLPVPDGLTANTDTIENPAESTAALGATRPFYDSMVAAVQNGKIPDIPKIDVIIIDYSFCLITEASAALCIPIYGFCPFAAKMLEQGLYYNENTPIVPDEEFFNAPKEGENFFSRIPESMKLFAEVMVQSRKFLKGMLLNTFRGLERDAIDKISAHEDFKGLPVKAIGPLIPHEGQLTADQQNLEDFVEQWLSTYPHKSVVYASFGSVATASAEQLVQRGEALLALKVPFIWSLRQFQQDHLPETFLRSDLGNLSLNATYLILPWAQQKAILAHPATAAFFSHCGWNSSLEAIAYGVPVCAWPMFADQHPNAGLLKEIGMAEILHKQGMKSEEVVSAEEIQKGIETVTGWDGEGNDGRYAAAAAEMRALVTSTLSPDGDSTKNFVEFMQIL